MLDAASGSSDKQMMLLRLFELIDGLPRTSRQFSGSSNCLARAMARVLAHELVHVVAPERGHAASGLMARQLTRHLLLRRKIELDIVSRTSARAAIENLVDTVRVAEAARARNAN